MKFTGNLKPGGLLILNKDDKPLFSLKNKFQGKNVIWYSLKNAKDAKQTKQIGKIIKIAGVHNLSNSLGAFKLAKSLGINDKNILKPLSKYTGAWRRMEYKGKFVAPNLKPEIQVYDDYAHHPTEVNATLQAFKGKFPESLLICVFQPHQIQRLNFLFKEFVKAFDKADVLILLDIYKVKGREELSHNMNSEKLANAIKKRKSGPKQVIYFPRPASLRNTIIKSLALAQEINKSQIDSAVVVMMGAGDIVNLTSKLIDA